MIKKTKKEDEDNFKKKTCEIYKKTKKKKNKKIKTYKESQKYFPT